MADLPSPKESLLARYTGEAFKALRDNAASPYIAVARTLLGQLRNRLALGGIAAGAHSVTLPDGTRIKVGVYGAINKLWIEVPSEAGKVTVTATYAYLSGLHEVTLFAIPLDDEIKWAGQFYPARETAAGIEREWYRYSNTADWAGWPVTDFAEDTALARFIRNWVYKTKPIKMIDSPKTRFYPSMYTGLMRKVVQKWHGQRLLNTGTAPPFGTNCGVFIPTGSGPVIERQRWVIVIERTGIYTFPIQFVDERIGLSSLERLAFPGWNQDRQDRYDYGMRVLPTFPALTVESFTDYDALPADDRRLYKVRIYTEADMDALHLDSYSDEKRAASDWYTPWAFDYTGRKACAVLVGVEPYNTTQNLYYSTLYEMTFGQDSHGRPSSVSVATISADYLLTWAGSVAPGPNAPQPLSMPHTFTGALAIFTWWGRPDNDYSAAQPAYRDAPVYAFYDRNNTRRVLMHRYEEYGPKPDEVIDDIVKSTWQAVRPAGQTYSAQYNWASPNFGDTYFEDRDNITRGYNCYYLDGVVDPEPEENARLLSLSSTQHGKVDEGWFYGGFGSYGDGTSDTEATSWEKLRTIQVFDSYHFVDFANEHHVGSPSYEREGLFFFQMLTQDAESRTVTARTQDRDTYPGLNGRAKWDYLGVPGWTIVETYATDAFVGFVVNWQGYDGSTLPLIGGTVTDSYTDPGGTSNDGGRYLYIGSHSTNGGVLELAVPTDPLSWFDDTEQIYEAANGAFTGDCIAAPWPDPTCWEYTCDYPVDSAFRWTASPIQFPDMMFVGDETTDSKTETRLIDLEAIRYG